MSLTFTLASRNLFHDRLRFIATLVGIVFSIVLVTIQMGLYLGFRHMVGTMIDHAGADLWIMPVGTKCFEDPSLLDYRKRFAALAVTGALLGGYSAVAYAQTSDSSTTTTTDGSSSTTSDSGTSDSTATAPAAPAQGAAPSDANCPNM